MIEDTQNFKGSLHSEESDFNTKTQNHTWNCFNMITKGNYKWNIKCYMFLWLFVKLVKILTNKLTIYNVLRKFNGKYM